MKYEMIESLLILKNFYVNENTVPEKKLIDKSEVFFNKYPYNFQQFVNGVSDGSGIPLEEVKMLNAMETLNSLLREKDEVEVAACLFVGIPATKASTGSSIIGRNYDFPKPFHKLAQYLTVTVMQEPDTVPTAFIAMAGQIYCPTCINKNSLFVELSNGMPSGGYQTDHSKKTLLINLLEVLQNSSTYKQLDMQLQALNSDYSLIINTADKEKFKSYEFSSYSVNKIYEADIGSIHVSTNFYLNQTWSEAPFPTDDITWKGVSRRDNMHSKFSDKDVYSIEDVLNIMDIDLLDGGSKWDLTIYQIVFDSSEQNLFLKRSSFDDEWYKVELGKLFAQEELNAGTETIHSRELHDSSDL
jgi:hypothetical protein